jgi:hypothetical protein
MAYSSTTTTNAAATTTATDATATAAAPRNVVNICSPDLFRNTLFKQS